MRSIPQMTGALHFSTRGEYGVRLMVELTRHFGAGPVSLAEMAEHESLPRPYLEQRLARCRAGAQHPRREGRLRAGARPGRDPDERGHRGARGAYHPHVVCRRPSPGRGLRPDRVLPGADAVGPASGHAVSWRSTRSRSWSWRARSPRTRGRSSPSARPPSLIDPSARSPSPTHEHPRPGHSACPRDQHR